MALVLKDRVRETTTTTGTGTITLAGAVAGFQSFSVIGNGNTTYYTITNGTDWEVGIGTYTASGTTLSRDTILESSNAGAAVNWGSGSKDVFLTYPAERSVYVDGSNIVPATSASYSGNVTTIQLRFSSTPGSVPTGASLSAGELVVNTADGKLYFKNSSGTVEVLSQVGSVTSVTGTSPVASSGGTTPAISLASGYGDTQNPFASKTANFFLAAPNGIAGAPTFRAIVAADIPTLNQNTTGTASNVTGTVAIANGGTGATTQQTALNALAGAVTSAQFLRGNGTNVVMSAIQASDVPTLNQNTTGTASNVTGTVAVANGGTGSTTASGARTNLGATTVGANFFTLVNPTAITFPRINADNTVSTLDAATFRTAIGAGVGSVTSVAMTVPAFLSVSGTPITSSGTLAVTLSGTALPVANGGTGVTTSTGTGSVVLSNSPTLVSPTLGQASATYVRFSAGTAALPSITVTGDIDTGFWFPAANTLAASTGGSERLRIDSSGNVGIGTASPTDNLDVVGTETASNVTVFARNLATTTNSNSRFGLRGNNDVVRATWLLDGLGTVFATGSILYTETNHPLLFGTNNVERMRITEGGNVGINVTSPANLLTVQTNATGTTVGSNVVARFQSNASGRDATIQLSDNVANSSTISMLSGATAFSQNGTERMRIDTSGNISVTQSPGSYTADVTPGSTSIANNGTVDFSNASGMLVVNNHANGNVTIYLCGGGTTTAVASVGAQVGTLTYVAGITGYRWTNTYGSTATFGFFFVRTRPAA